MEQTATATATISILYVEDDQEAREILLSMLEARYPEQRFSAAGNGLQGLERFRELRPAIVITDISMPEMDGLSMTAAIRALAPATIIIAVTAHSETDNLLQAIEIGINHYLLKPLDYGRVCNVIEQALAAVRQELQLQEQYAQITALNAALTARTRELEGLNCELEAFNYTVAHDLRSPMVSISGFSQLLLERHENDLDDSSIEALEAIHKETLRMNGLITALLNFSRYSRKSIEKQSIDLSGTVNEIRCHLQLREPQRRVAFSIAEGVQGFGDPLLIGVVLDNLVGNAWKYTGKTAAASIEFGTSTTEEGPIYFVRDNGAGFDLQEAANLFAPFKRLPSSEGFAGFGIGLATASRIIQRHGGRIWAEAEKGRGATFFFSL